MNKDGLIPGKGSVREIYTVYYERDVLYGIRRNLDRSYHGTVGHATYVLSLFLLEEAQ